MDVVSLRAPETENSVKFAALDGALISGRLFVPCEGTIPEVSVVVVGGAGVPARVYRHFAKYLSKLGIVVLTFDFRGIAESRPKKMRGFVATAEDWSEFDCGGAIEFLSRRYPTTKLCAVTHSIGGFLIGGATNTRVLSRIVFVGGHSGYFGDYGSRFRGQMALVWHVVMPALTRIVGYFPARALRLGEDIPSGVALQWAARRTPEFRPSKGIRQHQRAMKMLARHSTVNVPALALCFSDDAFGTRAGLSRLLAIYPNMRVAIREFSPKSSKMDRVGHFGFFAVEAEPILWASVSEFLMLATCFSTSPSLDEPGRPKRAGS